jgi:FkbM family methyltransferase
LPAVAEGGVDIDVARRFFSAPGVFVEVGAARPDFLSVSAHFRSLGWRIVSIEPIPEFCEMHRQAGHEVLQYACGEVDRDDVDFTVVDSHEEDYEDGTISFESFSSLSIKPKFSALKPTLDKHSIKVNVRRIDTILKQHAPEVGRIDVLCVDVEGWEMEVLGGLDFVRNRPKVMVVENFFYEQSYRRFARSKGYTLWRVYAPNDVYVANELLTAWERMAAAGRGFGRKLRHRR